MEDGRWELEDGRWEMGVGSSGRKLKALILKKRIEVNYLNS